MLYHPFLRFFSFFLSLSSHFSFPLPPSLFPSLLPSPNSLSSTHPSASTTHLWLFCIAVLKEAFSVIPSERQLLSKVGKLPRSPLCQLGIRPHFMVWITLSPASFSSWEVPCVAFFRWEWEPERRTGLWMGGWVSVWVGVQGGRSEEMGKGWIGGVMSKEIGGCDESIDFMQSLTQLNVKWTESWILHRDFEGEKRL